jgi:hypothetical protein
MDDRGPWTGHLTKPQQECPCLCHKGAVVLHVVPCCGGAETSTHVCNDGSICEQHPDQGLAA